MLLECCTQQVSKFGQHSSGHRMKSQFSLQSQRKCQRMFKLPHNYIHFAFQQGKSQNSRSQSSTICGPVCGLPDVQAGFRKDRNQRSNCQHPLDHRKIKGIPGKNIYFCFINYAKACDCGSQQTMKLSSRDGDTRLLQLSPEKPASQEATIRTLHGTIQVNSIKHIHIAV